MATTTAKNKVNKPEKVLNQDLADQKAALEGDGWKFNHDENLGWEAKKNGHALGHFEKLAVLLGEIEKIKDDAATPAVVTEENKIPDNTEVTFERDGEILSGYIHEATLAYNKVVIDYSVKTVIAGKTVTLYLPPGEVQEKNPPVEKSNVVAGDFQKKDEPVFAVFDLENSDVKFLTDGDVSSLWVEGWKYELNDNQVRITAMPDRVITGNYEKEFVASLQNLQEKNVPRGSGTTFSWLCNCPPSDSNFKSNLEKADAATIRAVLKSFNPAFTGNKTRIQKLEAQLRKLEKAKPGDIPMPMAAEADAAEILPEAVEMLLVLQFKTDRAKNDYDELAGKDNVASEDLEALKKIWMGFYNRYSGALDAAAQPDADEAEKIYARISVMEKNGWQIGLSDKDEWHGGKDFDGLLRGGEGYNSLKRLLAVCSRYESEYSGDLSSNAGDIDVVQSEPAEERITIEVPKSRFQRGGDIEQAFNGDALDRNKIKRMFAHDAKFYVGVGQAYHSGNDDQEENWIVRAYRVRPADDFEGETFSWKQIKDRPFSPNFYHGQLATDEKKVAWVLVGPEVIFTNQKSSAEAVGGFGDEKVTAEENPLTLAQTAKVSDWMERGWKIAKGDNGVWKAEKTINDKPIAVTDKNIDEVFRLMLQFDPVPAGVKEKPTETLPTSEIKKIKFELTDEDVLIKNNQFLENDRIIEQKKAELKETTKFYKKAIEDLETQQTDLKDQMSSRIEYRPVECPVDYDLERGEKIYYRPDNQEQVDRVTMSKDELRIALKEAQRDLF